MTDKLMVLRWLLSQSGVLREVAALAAKWDDAQSLSQKLEIVYKVALALIPVIDSFPLFKAQALPVTEEEANQDLQKVEALGLPIPLLVNVVAPIVLALVRILMRRKAEE